MAQFCRYCDHMESGERNWCEVRKRCYSDAHLKHTNRCRHFALNPIDALRENRRGYVPRPAHEPKAEDEGQTTIWDFLEVTKGDD